MQRLLIWAMSLGSLAGGMLLLLFAPEPLHNWWRMTFQGEMVRWLPHLPVLLLLMAGMWGWHLHQGEMALLVVLLLGAHVLLAFPFPQRPPPEALREGLGVVLPWAFPVLLSWPETSLRSLWGWARLGVTLSIWLGALIWAWNPGFAAFSQTHLAQVPGGVKCLSTFLALMALWGLPFTWGHGLRLPWASALIALGVASLHGEPWWPETVSDAPWPVFLSFGAIFLLGGLYGLTWRRAYLDELTEIPGRRAFEESLRRLGKHYAIAMVDVDHFKYVNDRYGHQFGDDVLRFIATRLKRMPLGRAFRYGGEEFAVIMPGRRVQGALPHLEGLRLSIEKSPLTIRGRDRPLRKPKLKDRPPGGREQVGITVSVGVAHRSLLHPTAEEVVKAADEALYRAKGMGRNRVEAEQGRRREESIAQRMNYHQRKMEKRDGRKRGETWF